MQPAQPSFLLYCTNRDLEISRQNALDKPRPVVVRRSPLLSSLLPGLFTTSHLDPNTHCAHIAGFYVPFDHRLPAQRLPRPLST
ncbi:hypothetical protein [Sporisorium scitamineum]|uniref:Uncharacterized protein n=1 Tax=Sporisorium scitamineum TaxID=49012 RepID=A0A0F7S6M7_9BASI|nr:hypothetical protein [Sporisorium scitamineum]